MIPMPPGAQPASYAPPPFLVPTPQFIASQTAPPSIINYVPGPNGPLFQPNYQGFNPAAVQVCSNILLIQGKFVRAGRDTVGNVHYKIFISRSRDHHLLKKSDFINHKVALTIIHSSSHNHSNSRYPSDDRRQRFPYSHLLIIFRIKVIGPGVELVLSKCRILNSSSSSSNSNNKNSWFNNSCSNIISS